MIELTPQDIAEYCLNIKREIRWIYFWGQEYSKVHQYLIEHEDKNNPDTYVIEYSGAGGPNARIFQNKSVYEKVMAYEKKSREQDEIARRQESPVELPINPLVIQLYEACDKKDFQLILGLKQQLRELRIPYDKERTKIRNLI